MFSSFSSSAYFMKYAIIQLSLKKKEITILQLYTLLLLLQQ